MDQANINWVIRQHDDAIGKLWETDAKGNDLYGKEAMAQDYIDFSEAIKAKIENAKDDEELAQIPGTLQYFEYQKRKFDNVLQ